MTAGVPLQRVLANTVESMAKSWGRLGSMMPLSTGSHLKKKKTTLCKGKEKT